MSQPLAEKALPFFPTIFGTDNRFINAKVISRLTIINYMALKVGIKCWDIHPKRNLLTHSRITKLFANSRK